MPIKNGLALTLENRFSQRISSIFEEDPSISSIYCLMDGIPTSKTNGTNSDRRCRVIKFMTARAIEFLSPRVGIEVTTVTATPRESCYAKEMVPDEPLVLCIQNLLKTVE